MERFALKKDIIDKTFTSQGWGAACNHIQDVAFEVLSMKELSRISAKCQKDFESCDGSDYLLLNGQYFDWKEFGPRYRDIVAAYLDYYTDAQLKLIFKRLQLA